MAALTAAEIDQIVAAWPDDDAELPASVLSAFRGWMTQTLAVINPALARLNDDETVGWTTPAPAVSFNKNPKCRTLTAHGVAPPLGVTPSVFELRAMLPVEEGADNVAPEIRRQLQEMAAQLRAAEGTIATLVRQTSTDDNDDVTTEYVIHPTVVGRLPKSFVDLHPLSHAERKKIVRTPDPLWSVSEGPLAKPNEDVRCYTQLQGDAVGEEADVAAICDGAFQVHGPSVGSHEADRDSTLACVGSDD